MNDQEVFDRLLQLVERYYASRKTGKLLEYYPPRDLAALLDLDKAAPLGSWPEIFGWIEKYLQYCVKTGHHRFVNRMWSEANLPSVLGEMITALTNTSACTYEAAPVSTLMEQYMIQQMLDITGFTAGIGQMTTGSSNANMIAMMLARNNANSTVKQAGLFGQQKLFGFVSKDSHYSMDKAANILGLGIDQLIRVPVDVSGVMIVEELQRLLEMVVANGGQPFFVTATAGSTVRGAYDPILPLLDLRDRYDFWLHVDGAWGGAAVFSDTLRHRYLAGLERADSFTCDFHKMLGSALMCNVLLINGRKDILGTVLAAGDTSYLFRDEDIREVDDFGTVSLQCGRRVDSLKWFLDWKFFGREGLAARVENYLALSEYAEQLIRNSDRLEMVVPRTSFNVCFRVAVDEGKSNEFNLALRTRLYKEGEGLIAVAYVEGRLVMRLLITNPDITRKDIDSLFAAIIASSEELRQEMRL